MAGYFLAARGFPSSVPDPGIVTASTPHLPFDMPVDAHWNASTSLMAPHLMTQFVRASQNKNVETDATSYEKRKWIPYPTEAEGATDYRQYGGFWRNYPLGRVPYSPSPAENTDAMKLLDRRFEMKAMKATGMRHMIVDILGGDPINSVNRCAEAAVLEGMNHAIIAMPDCSSAFVTAGAATLANNLEAMFTSANAAGYYKHTDGRWMVMPYAPEFVGASSSAVITFWRTVMQNMESKGLPCALWPVFSRSWLDPTKFTAPTFTDPLLASWVVGLGRWGTGTDPVTAASTSTSEGGAQAYSMATYGLPFLYSARIEDQRPTGQNFYESGGWDNVATGMNTGINNNMGAIQIPTWNDRAEGSAIEPSVYHGYADLDVLSYFACKRRLGYNPPIIRDTTYLAHRVQQGLTITPQPTYTADPSATTYTKKQTTRTGSTPERNQVDVLVFATAPRVLKIRVGGSTQTTNVPAGMTRVQATLAAGTISCWLEATGGGEISNTRVDSPWDVSFTSRLVQDLSYRRRGSRDSLATRPT